MQKSPMSINLTTVADGEFLKKIEDDPQALVTAVPESVTRLERLPIAEMPGGFHLAADVYYREKYPAKPRPALIFMHDWASGKQPVLSGNRQCAYLALKANMLGVVLYYRQPGDGHFPAAIEDLKCALRWLRSIAEDYAIDPNRIIVMGSSAGTQWTWLAAATSGLRDYNGVGGYDKFSSEVNLSIINSGICDFVKDFGNRDIGQKVIGGTVDDMPERYHEASPLNRFRAGMPPVIMIHGELDQSCPLSSAKAACERLQQLGVPVELVVRPKCGHGIDGFGFNLGSHLDTALAFVRRQWPDVGSG